VAGSEEALMKVLVEVLAKAFEGFISWMEIVVVKKECDRFNP
jgi:hypothetical protein